VERKPWPAAELDAEMTVLRVKAIFAAKTAPEHGANSEKLKTQQSGIG